MRANQPLEIAKIFKGLFMFCFQLITESCLHICAFFFYLMLTGLFVMELQGGALKDDGDSYSLHNKTSQKEKENI